MFIIVHIHIFFYIYISIYIYIYIYFIFLSSALLFGCRTTIAKSGVIYR